MVFKCDFKILPLNFQFVERRILFGHVPLNMRTTRTAILHNTGQNHAMFYVINSAPFPGMTVTPVHGVVPVGGNAELKVIIRSVETWIVWTSCLTRLWKSNRFGLQWQKAYFFCNLSVGVALNVRFTTNGMCAKNNTDISVARTSNKGVMSSVDMHFLLAATVWSFAHFPIATLRFSGWQKWLLWVGMFFWWGGKQNCIFRNLCKGWSHEQICRLA